jgi:radical SAM superfamily enzyme YgiQ (UPF0313 family)
MLNVKVFTFNIQHLAFNIGFLDYRLRQEVAEKLQGEIGTCYRASGDKISVVLVYPNTYYVGMSNLGFQAIYGFLNARDNVYCERAFLPDSELLTVYEHTRTPVFSYESQKPLAEFEIIAFSVSFENDYLNILKILELARVPFKSEERTAADPLLILGGTVTTINPEPLALFFDLVVLGDGEPVLEQVLTTYQDCAAECSRQALLGRMATIPGVYIPSLYQVEYSEFGHIHRIVPHHGAPETVVSCIIPDLIQYPAYTRIFTDQTEFGDLFLLEIERGCCYKCRFCHTGYSQNPIRYLPLQAALPLIEQGLHYRQRIGLIGPAIADYPALQELGQAIAAHGGNISVSSLRVSALRKSDVLLNMLIQIGQKTVTIAPEAGAERLRKILGKALSNEALYETVEYVAKAQIPNLKLYFLVGLPTETHEDLDILIEVCKKCNHILQKAAKIRGKSGKLTISVNPFVPKPFTPLQWCPMASEAELKRKILKIKSALSRFSNMEVIHELPKWAVWQGILARGDRKIGHVLLLTLQYQGVWKKAFRDLNMNPDFYAHRSRNGDEKLPWDFMTVGLSRQALFDEYQGILG